ncbi:hypothetical protein EVAR_4745_1 [Eumeta japonica]|uniref:Uncharacterized protein n=1 Tax=Eumeta variegata TaxID=151549 RepID=A0A4C1T1D9_EUMVA|nr:hypothetical protein EVAR_4745_1 [Eumeta japonica]
MTKQGKRQRAKKKKKTAALRECRQNRKLEQLRMISELLLTDPRPAPPARVHFRRSRRFRANLLEVLDFERLLNYATR